MKDTKVDADIDMTLVIMVRPQHAIQQRQEATMIIVAASHAGFLVLDHNQAIIPRKCYLTLNQTHQVQQTQRRSQSFIEGDQGCTNNLNRCPMAVQHQQFKR